MANPFLAVPLALHLIAASGGGVPTLDVRPSCRAAAATQITSTDRMQTCMAGEQDAHDQLVKLDGIQHRRPVQLLAHHDGL